MRRLAFFSFTGFFLALAANVVHASSCVSIVNDNDRLSCFDASGHCSRISSAEDRLVCFDEVYAGSHSKTQVVETKNDRLAPVSAGVASMPSGDETAVESKAVVSSSVGDKEAVSSSVSAVQGEAEAGFGKKKEFTDPVVYIEAKIVDVMRNAQKIDYIRLDNGHIWREYKDYRIRYKVGRKVIIEEGVLGSYNLKIEGVKKLIKVKRMN